MNPKMGLMPFNVREKMKNVLKYDMLFKIGVSGGKTKGSATKYENIKVY